MAAQHTWPDYAENLAHFVRQWLHPLYHYMSSLCVTITLVFMEQEKKLCRLPRYKFSEAYNLLAACG